MISSKPALLFQKPLCESLSKDLHKIHSGTQTLTSSTIQSPISQQSFAQTVAQNFQFPTYRTKRLPITFSSHHTVFFKYAIIVAGGRWKCDQAVNRVFYIVVYCYMQKPSAVRRKKSWLDGEMMLRMIKYVPLLLFFTPISLLWPVYNIKTHSVTRVLLRYNCIITHMPYLCLP